MELMRSRINGFLQGCTQTMGDQPFTEDPSTEERILVFFGDFGIWADQKKLDHLWNHHVFSILLSLGQKF